MVDGRGSKGQPLCGGVARLPLHPLFAAAYPVLFLFGANAADQVTADAWHRVRGGGDRAERAEVREENDSGR